MRIERSHYLDKTRVTLLKQNRLKKIFAVANVIVSQSPNRAFKFFDAALIICSNQSDKRARRRPRLGVSERLRQYSNLNFATYFVQHRKLRHRVFKAG